MKESSCEIPLGRHGEHVAIVSEEDYAFLTRWRWNYKRSRGGNIYARRGGGTKPGHPNRPTILMHSVVCERHHGPRPSEEHTPHHKNLNSLDNRGSNLEWGTRSHQNKYKRSKKRPDVAAVLAEYDHA